MNLLILKILNAKGRKEEMMINPFITRKGNGGVKTNVYIEGGSENVGMDIFERGLCLLSDNKMTAEKVNQIIETIKSCFM